jgi:hypothetical protein
LPNGKSGLGIGPQEEFYNCADIQINNSGTNDNDKKPPGQSEFIEMPVEVTTKRTLATTKTATTTTTTTTLATTTTTTTRKLLSTKSHPTPTVAIESLLSKNMPTTISIVDLSQLTEEVEGTNETSAAETTTLETIYVQEIEESDVEVKIEGDDPAEVEEETEAANDDEEEEVEVEAEVDQTVTKTSNELKNPTAPAPVISQILQLLLTSSSSPTTESSPTTSSPMTTTTTTSSFFHCEKLPPSLVPFIETSPDPNEFKGIPLCLLIGDSLTTCKDCYERCMTPLKQCPREYCYCKWYV